uniref:Uncharacterized protein n=1 Tax=Solanum tuberosum TaxID=4113 RepID=M1E0I3_SOLTU
MHCSKTEYETRPREMDLVWLWDTLIEDEHHDRVYWATTEASPALTSSSMLRGDRVKEDLAAIWRRLRGTYASTSAPVPPFTAFEVEMLCRQLRWERKKSIKRDCLMGRMWKAIKCAEPRWKGSSRQKKEEVGASPRSSAKQYHVAQ